MSIESKVAGIRSYPETLLVTDRQRSFLEEQKYLTWEIIFSPSIDINKISFLRRRVISDLESYLRGRGFPEATSVKREDVDLVGIAEIGYILRTPETDPTKNEEDAVAVSYPSPYHNSMKLRLRDFNFKQPGFFARLLGSRMPSNEFYSCVEGYFRSLVEKAAEAQSLLGRQVYSEVA